MTDELKTGFCYLPASPDALDWGLYTVSTGYSFIPKGLPYPPAKHPDDHNFSWKSGRILNSYSFVYITRGHGEFESAQSKLTKVGSGTLFILYPGIRHRYRPDPKTGWDEYWVEFDGPQAKRIMSHAGFSEKKPIIEIGNHEEILRLFIEITRASQTQPPGFEHIIAAQTSQIAAHLLARILRGTSPNRKNEEKIRQARFLITEKAESILNMESISRELGMSYSVFRKHFKQITGLAPKQYQLQIRIRRAKTLLHTTSLSVQDIAEKTGFESVYYFSRAFKAKTDRSPLEFRKQAQESPFGK